MTPWRLAGCHAAAAVSSCDAATSALFISRGLRMTLSVLRTPLVAASLLMLAACAGTPASTTREPDERGATDPMLAASGITHAVVREAFVTPLTPEDNIDSPALWRGPDGSAALLATAKATGRNKSVIREFEPTAG